MRESWYIDYQASRTIREAAIRKDKTIKWVGTYGWFRLGVKIDEEQEFIDSFYKNLPMFQDAAIEATKLLTKLGFQKMFTYAVSSEKVKGNRHTGGKVEPSASAGPQRIQFHPDWSKEDFSGMLVHEWAHRYEFNVLSKEQKAQLKNYYETKVHGAIDNLEDGEINKFWGTQYNLLEIVEKNYLNVGSSTPYELIEKYLKSENAYNDFLAHWRNEKGHSEDFYQEEYSQLDVGSPEFTKALISALPHGATFPAITKVPLTIEDIRRVQKNIPAGTEVEIFVAPSAGTLLIDWRDENRTRYSKEAGIPQSEVFNFLEVNLTDWVNSRWGEEFKERYEYTASMFNGKSSGRKKGPLSRKEMYARGEENKEVIVSGISYVLRSALSKSQFSRKFRGDAFFEDFRKGDYIWKLWQNLTARGRDFQYIFNAIADKLLKEMSYHMQGWITDEYKKEIFDVVKRNIGKPPFQEFRIALAQKVNFPQGYSVNNESELWATTLEHASLGKLKNPELLQMIRSIISGTYIKPKEEE